MKRLLFFSVCVLLAGAPMVNADYTMLFVKETRTYYDNSWDALEMHLSEVVSDVVPADDVISGLFGTWSAIGGVFNLPGGVTWYNNVTNDYDKQDRAAPQTWINFSTRSPDVPARYKADGSNGGDTTSQSFYVGEYNTPAGSDGIPCYAIGSVDLTPGIDPNPIWDEANQEWVQHPGYGFDNTLLVKFYISKSTDYVAFKGMVGFQGAFGGDPHTIEMTFPMYIPEPSTIVLLGSGLLGLLAYAWRQRKLSRSSR